jgi:hypothetical protein
MYLGKESFVIWMIETLHPLDGIQTHPATPPKWQLAC